MASSNTLQRKASFSSTSRPIKRSKLAAQAPPKAAPPTSDSGSEGSDQDDSGSGDDDDEEEDAEATKAAMLRALEAHGMSMFGSSIPSAPPSQASKGKRRASVDLDMDLEVSEDDDDEDDDESFDENDSEGGIEDDDERFSDGEGSSERDEEQELPVASTSSSVVRKPVEVTFDPSAYQGGPRSTKAEYKAFMVSPLSRWKDAQTLLCLLRHEN